MAANDYEGKISISAFAGINQSNEGINTDMRYAASGWNFDTTHGILRPFKAGTCNGNFAEVFPPVGATNGDGTRTLAFLYRRWNIIDGGVVAVNKRYAVIVHGGVLFYRTNIDNASDTGWVQLTSADLSEFYFPNNSRFDCLAYELNYAPPVTLTQAICASIDAGNDSYMAFDVNDYEYKTVEVTLVSEGVYSAAFTSAAAGEIALTVGTSKVRQAYADAPVDALLMTNSDYGMFCVYAPHGTDTLSVAAVEVKPTGTTENIKFGAIARHIERIWGAGIDSDPDKLIYSAPNDPFCWEQNDSYPADGAGDVQQPNWDGDKFVALRSFGSQLLAIKRRRIWRLLGTTPEDFTFREQYGDGTVAEDTVVVYGSYVYMLSNRGLLVYDGTSTYPLKYGMVDDYISAYSDNLADAFAAMYGDKYCLVLNNATIGGCVLIYNVTEGTFNVCKLQQYENPATAIAESNGELFIMRPYPEYFIDPTYPHYCMVKMFSGSSMDMRWVSAWQDLQAKYITKSAFVIYLAVECSADIDVTVGVRTEKKLKTKRVTLKNGKVERVRVNNKGRRFRLELGVDKCDADWFSLGGIQITVEYDAD